MPLIVVASGKGGVTKTTTTYALSAALRDLGLEPTLLDLDPGASLTENAGLIADGAHARDLLEGRSAIELLLAETVDGIPIVPGTAQLLGAGNGVDDLIRYARQLRDVSRERLIIVDTAQGLALAATRAALLAADHIVVPMQAEPAVIRRSYPDVLALLRVFRGTPELRAEFAINPELLFVMTKANTRLGLTRHELDRLAKDGVQVAAYVPSAVAAAECCLTGQSVVAYAPRSPVSAGYRDLARTLVASLNRGKLSLSAAQ
jgi:cellulose biosynthesis protein BcsQ